MASDPIPALESLGYTEREAAFLYLVAVHSGYFLRRQFDYFVNRNKGSIVMRFLEKARNRGHIQLLDTEHRRQTYHLFYKPIYRLVGKPDSQNRRVKSDTEVRARLMRLDYVLENDEEHYLENEEAKLHYFTQTRGITPDLLSNSQGSLLSEIQTTLISLADRTQTATTLVRFVFIDEGLLTVTKFQRMFTSMRELLRAAGNTEVIYVATSDHNFREAAAWFRKEVTNPELQRQPFLDADWRNVSRHPFFPRSQFVPRFTTLLLRWNYPSLRRNERQGSQQSSLSTRETT